MWLRCPLISQFFLNLKDLIFLSHSLLFWQQWLKFIYKIPVWDTTKIYSRLASNYLVTPRPPPSLLSENIILYYTFHHNSHIYYLCLKNDTFFLLNWKNHIFLSSLWAFNPQLNWFLTSNANFSIILLLQSLNFDSQSFNNKFTTSDIWLKRNWTQKLE